MRYHLKVDAVFCISLRERSDRRETIKKEFSVFEHEIEFIIVERDTENPERGCYHSHRLCAQIALDRGYKRILVLEDDATLLRPKKDQIKWINSFLRWRDPKIFYLGGILGRMWLIPWKHIVRCRLTGAQAYVLSEKGCSILAASEYYGMAVDSFFCKAFKAYGTYPMLSQQQPDGENNSAIAEYRKKFHGQKYIKDENFWEMNISSQERNLRKHWLRTLLMRY